MEGGRKVGRKEGEMKEGMEKEDREKGREVD